MEWTDRYEKLRQHVLQPTGPSFDGTPGLAVLLQRGVAAWMRVWSDCALLPHAPSSWSRSTIVDPASSVSDLSDQWIRLLVDMLLRSSREVHA